MFSDAVIDVALPTRCANSVSVSAVLSRIVFAKASQDASSDRRDAEPGLQRADPLLDIGRRGRIEHRRPWLS